MELKQEACSLFEQVGIFFSQRGVDFPFIFSLGQIHLHETLSSLQFSNLFLPGGQRVSSLQVITSSITLLIIVELQKALL